MVWRAERSFVQFGVGAPQLSFCDGQAEILVCSAGFGMAVMINQPGPSIGGCWVRYQQSIGPPFRRGNPAKKGN
jgi:hypothetical protein